MAELNSFCDLPQRDDFRQFEVARNAHIHSRPAVIRDSRSSAVLQALMDMQDQLQRLQHEKSTLNRRFEELTEETSRYKTELQKTEVARSTVVPSSDLVSRLEDARRQLERARVSRDEPTSTVSHNRKKQVHHVILDDDSDYESDTPDDNIPVPNPPSKPKHRPSPSSSSSRPRSGSPVFHHADQEHYHLNLAHLPFVVGQSTAPSHSLAGNLQEVLAQLKRHHPIICDHVNAHAHRRPSSANDCSSRSTISSRAKQIDQRRRASYSPDRRKHTSQHNRQLLRDMRSLHNTLQKDDVCWT